MEGKYGMGLLWIAAGITGAVLVIGCLFRLVQGKTDLDRKTDDEQQMKYMEEYQKKRLKGGH